MEAALAEFAAKGLAGARTDAIARRAGVNERMIFYCFETKEGLYREVLRRKLAQKADIIESTADDDFATALIRGYESSCSDSQHVRMWQWEALDTGRRKIVAEEERRALVQREIAQVRRAQQRGELPADIDEDLLLLVRIGLLIAPVAFPQFTRLVAGMVMSMALLDEWLFPLGKRRPSRQRIVNEMVAFMLHGLAHRPAVSEPAGAQERPNALAL